MRLRGERVDDGAGQDEIEFRGLQHPVIARSEQSEAFERVAHHDDEQQGDRLDECVHVFPPCDVAMPDGR